MLSVIRDLEELEAARAEWSELWRNDGRATPFQSPEWLLPWCRYLYGGGQIWTVAQRHEGRLVSLLPAFRWGADLGNLSLIGTGVSDYLDLLGEPIHDIPGDWRDTAFEELRPDSPLLQLGAGEACSVCPVITLPDSMTKLLREIDPKLAIDIHRSSNRLHRMGGVRIERTTDIEDLFRLHEARWNERQEEGMLSADKLQAFHREVATGFEALGILRLYRLMLNDNAAAVIYAFTHRARTYAYLSGFDPALSKASPGTVLLAHVIERAFSEGVREFDFLRQAESYKYKWNARDQTNYRVRITR